MERLDDFASEDLVSRVVRDLRVQSTVFCRSELSAPWGFAVQPRDLAAFHVVLGGDCVLEAGGIDGATALETGDLVILPRGQAHTVRDRPDSAVTALDLLTAAGFDGYELRHGGGGTVTELLCGGFVVGGREASALVAALPPFVVVRGESGRPAAWLEDLLGSLRRELERPGPGGREVVARLADVLLAQALRTFLVDGKGAELPPLRALEAATSPRRSHSSTSIPSADGRWASSRRARPCRAPRSPRASASSSASRRCATCAAAGSRAPPSTCAPTTAASRRSRASAATTRRCP